MQRKVFWLLVILSFIFLLSSYMVTIKGRYSIKTVSPGIAYEIDHLTGRTWIIIAGKEWPVVLQGKD